MDFLNHPNRQKKLFSKKKVLYWCVCDRNYIGHFGQCSVCLRRPHKKGGVDKRKIKGNHSAGNFD